MKKTTFLTITLASSAYLFTWLQWFLPVKYIFLLIFLLVVCHLVLWFHKKQLPLFILTVLVLLGHPWIIFQASIADNLVISATIFKFFGYTCLYTYLLNRLAAWRQQKQLILEDAFIFFGSITAFYAAQSMSLLSPLWLIWQLPVTIILVRNYHAYVQHKLIKSIIFLALITSLLTERLLFTLEGF